MAEPIDIEFDLFVTQEGINEGGDDDQVIITVEPISNPPNLSQLKLEIEVDKNPINTGQEQTIRIIAYNRITNQNVENANIDGIITYSNSYSKDFRDIGGIYEAILSIEIRLL